MLYREQPGGCAFSELYHANGAERLRRPRAVDDVRADAVDFERAAPLDTIASPTASQSWSLDALGNLTSVTTDSTTQTETANQQNEITSVSGATTPDVRRQRQPDDRPDGQHVRLRRLEPAGAGQERRHTVLAAYSYDALGRRITETHSGTTTRTCTIPSAWQVLEEDWGGADAGAVRLEPGVRGRAGERDRDPTDGHADQRLYVQQDANWNVTALVDTIGQRAWSATSTIRTAR